VDGAGRNGEGVLVLMVADEAFLLPQPRDCLAHIQSHTAVDALGARLLTDGFLRVHMSTTTSYIPLPGVGEAPEALLGETEVGYGEAEEEVDREGRGSGASGPRRPCVRRAADVSGH
jgi:hypothetical protein